MALVEEIRCQHCGEVIGVYEPLIVVVDDEAVHTSRAAVQDGLSPDGPYFHGHCFTHTHHAAGKA